MMVESGQQHQGKLKGNALDPREQREYSHLCHNNCCFNAAHVALETKVANQARNVCQRARVCIGHTPRCILEDPVAAVLEIMQCNGITIADLGERLG
jgi:hypothetical protein